MHVTFVKNKVKYIDDPLDLSINFIYTCGNRAIEHLHVGKENVIISNTLKFS